MKRIGMMKIKDILRHRHDFELPRAQIAAAVGVSTGTVSHVLARAEAAGLSWPLPSGLDDEALRARLYPAPDQDSDRTQPDWDAIVEALTAPRKRRRARLTRRQLWVEYRDEVLAQGGKAYTYSRFCGLLKERLHSRPGPVQMRFHYEPGLWGLSDFSGKTLALRTGRGDKDVEIFVAVLAHSNLTYVEAVGAAVVGEADHALHGGEGLFGEVARGEAAFGPGQRVGSDAACAGEQDVAVVGLADIAHSVQAVGHMVGVGGVLVAPGLQTMDGDPLAAPVEEEFDRALADAGMDLAPNMALGGGVVVVGDADVAARPDLAFDPLAPFPGGPGQRLEERAFVGFEQGAPALAACHGGLVEPVELAPDRGVHRLQREEGLTAQHEQDARLDRPDAGFDEPLVRRPPRARRQHGDPVVPGELGEARIEPGLLAVRLVHAGLEVVDDPAGGDAAEVLKGAAVRHDPVTHALVGERLDALCAEALDVNRLSSGFLRDRLRAGAEPHRPRAEAGETIPRHDNLRGGSYYGNDKGTTP